MARRKRLKPASEGEWLTPRRRGYLLGCCDCGLVHTINFRLVKYGQGHRVQFQAFRNDAETKRQKRLVHAPR